MPRITKTSRANGATQQKENSVVPQSKEGLGINVVQVNNRKEETGTERSLTSLRKGMKQGQANIAKSKVPGIIPPPKRNLRMPDGRTTPNSVNNKSTDNLQQA